MFLVPRAFLVQKLLTEECVNLCLSDSLAVLLIPPRPDGDQDEEALEEARERATLWADYIRRIIDQKVLRWLLKNLLNMLFTMYN